MKTILLFAVLISVLLSASAQEISYKLGEDDIFNQCNDSTLTTDAKIIADKNIQDLMKEHISINQKKGVEGYRVQIFLGTGRSARDNAQEVRSEFMKKYPEYQSYLVHDYPYFKVKVGDFRTRNEAMKLKKQLEKQFVNTWVVEDKIDYPALKHN